MSTEDILKAIFLPGVLLIIWILIWIKSRLPINTHVVFLVGLLVAGASSWTGGSLLFQASAASTVMGLIMICWPASDTFRVVGGWLMIGGATLAFYVTTQVQNAPKMNMIGGAFAALVLGALGVFRGLFSSPKKDGDRQR